MSDKVDYTKNAKEVSKENKEVAKENKETNEKAKITPVVTSKVTRKKNIGRNVSNSFFGEELSSVKSYILMDVLIPAAKKAISDIVSNGIDMLLYGETKNKKTTNSSSVSYRNYRDCYNNDSKQYNANTTRFGYSYDDVVIATRTEASEVLRQMDELVDLYGVVTVADFYDLVGVSGNYTDNKYGWTNIRNAEIVRSRNGYIIRLPKVLPID